MGLSFISIRFNRGFTLIEVMVVVAIIGILASVLFASFEEGRQQSRDKFRQSELKELQLAIELYKAQNGSYPATGCGQIALHWSGPGPHPSWGMDCQDYITGLVPDYIGSLPRDPKSEDVNGVGFIYSTNSDQSGYKLLSHQAAESLFVTSYTDEFARCPSACGVCGAIGLQSNVYAVYSNGAECW